MLRPLLFALLTLAASSAAAQNTRVTTASELRSAIAGAQPGDTIVMANGRWTDLTIGFRANGTEADSIRLVAETPGEVILDGNSSLRIGGDYLVVDGLRFEGGELTSGHVVQFRDGALVANHSRLTNSAIIDYNPENRNIEYKWVSIYGTYNRVDHSYIAGKTNGGTTLVVWLEPASSHEPTYHRIDHNHFGPRPRLGRNGGETIRIGTSDRSMQDAFVTVERNLFERCDGEIEIISNKSGKNVFRGNTFLRSRGTLTLRHGNGALVEGNVFLGLRGDDTGGVRVIGEDHVVVNNYFELLNGTGLESAIAIMNGVPNSPLNRYFQVKNAVIAHNTIVRSQDALTLGAGADSERTLAPDSVVFHNNVILSQGNTIVDVEAEPTRMSWDGTVYWGGSLGIDEPAGVTNVNPLIEPSGDGLWRPLDGSPLFDAAAPVPGLDLPSDLDGQPRDDQPDIGADERSSDAPSRLQPLTADDVGTTWPVGTASELESLAPSALSLGAPFPNPARSRAVLPLFTLTSAHVEVSVYDVLGRRVRTLLDSSLAPGARQLDLDTRDLAAGTYQVVARADGSVARVSLVVSR